MEKLKMTKKSILNRYNNIIQIGYCNAQNLLKSYEPFGYTSGIYGWNADIYSFKNTAIVTGYRPFGNIEPSYELIKKYDEKAKKILNKYTNHNDMEDAIYNLIDEFVTESIRG